MAVAGCDGDDRGAAGAAAAVHSSADSKKDTMVSVSSDIAPAYSRNRNSPLRRLLTCCAAPARTSRGGCKSGYERAGRAQISVAATLPPAGVSTRRMDKVMALLGITGTSWVRVPGVAPVWQMPWR